MCVCDIKMKLKRRRKKKKRRTKLTAEEMKCWASLGGDKTNSLLIIIVNTHFRAALKKRCEKVIFLCLDAPQCLD